VEEALPEEHGPNPSGLPRVVLSPLSPLFIMVVSVMGRCYHSKQSIFFFAYLDEVRDEGTKALGVGRARSRPRKMTGAHQLGAMGGRLIKAVPYGGGGGDGNTYPVS